MAERKETYIGNSKLKGSPKDKYKFILGRNVVKTDNIADGAITTEKISGDVVVPTKIIITYIRWWDNESTDAHKEEANPGDYFYKADTDSLYVAKEIEGSIEWERTIIGSAILYVKVEGDQFGVGKDTGDWGSLLEISSVTAIKDLIPEEATKDNQLADKNYVNTGISTATADFKGTFDSLEELQQVTDANANDYGFVIVTDEEGNISYDRYKYVEGTGWLYEYTLDNSSNFKVIKLTNYLTKGAALPTNDNLIYTYYGKVIEKRMCKIDGDNDAILFIVYRDVTDYEMDDLTVLAYIRSGGGDYEYEYDATYHTTYSNCPTWVKAACGISIATSDNAGLMSTSDKDKLDEIKLEIEESTETIIIK